MAVLLMYFLVLVLLQFESYDADCIVGSPHWIGDNICDYGAYNTADCDWDGGDCCEFNCAYYTDTAYHCDDYNCETTAAPTYAPSHAANVAEDLDSDESGANGQTATIIISVIGSIVGCFCCCATMCILCFCCSGLLQSKGSYVFEDDMGSSKGTTRPEGEKGTEQVEMLSSVTTIGSPAMTTAPSANEVVLQAIWKEEGGADDDDIMEETNGDTQGTVGDDVEEKKEEEEEEEDDGMWDDEQYTKVRDFFENEVLVVASLRVKYFKLCIKNGIDSLEALKSVEKHKLIDIGIDPLDVGTILIKTKTIKL